MQNDNFNSDNTLYGSQSGEPNRNGINEFNIDQSVYGYENGGETDTNQTPYEPHFSSQGDQNAFVNSESVSPSHQTYSESGFNPDDPTDFGYEARIRDNSGYGYQPDITAENGKKQKPKKSHGGLTVFLCIILSVLVSAGSCIAVLNYASSSKSSEKISIVPNLSKESGSVENVNINIDEEASSIAQAVSRKCNKSVVGIRTTVATRSFFGGSDSATGEGSGVVYTDDGYIITNYHVIKDAAVNSSGKIDVYLESVSTKPYSAKVIGFNIASDLAVLKIDAKNLSPIDIGDSDKLSVGQYAITIGAPGGLQFMGSVTYGVISGLNRVVSTDSSLKLIQTDAAINPGNSGGALLNENGALIGINSSKIVAEEFEGMGFAIPVNTAVKICDNIIKNKDKVEPYVGITVSESYSADDLESYGYPAGAVVLSVAEGSTAEECGIARGDIITKFNGSKIKDFSDYYKALKSCKPGTEVEIEIFRRGREYSAKITVASNSYSGNN
ncbi:MAG TPA: peptidase S1 [Ruminococcaceae bacterium]|nr:peptidase S1 [Oscillospiraceae bacterium]